MQYLLKWNRRLQKKCTKIVEGILEFKY